MKLNEIITSAKSLVYNVPREAKRIYRKENVQKALFITQIALVSLAVLAGLVALTVFYPITGAIVISAIAAGSVVGIFKAYLHHKAKQ